METFTAVRWVLIYTMFLNLFVSALKIAVALLTGSLSILANGLDSIFDSLTNVMGIIAISFAQRPPDADHPYGHRRYETLMTLGVAALLFISCYSILWGAYQRLRNPIVIQVNFWSFASLLLGMVVHIFTARFELRRGKELKSEFLIADASHTRADILVTLTVIAGLVVGYPLVDSIMAVIVAFVIAKIGIDIIRNSARILTDAAAVETDQVAAVMQQIPGIQSYHHIRSRGQEDDVHLDLHIRVAPDMPLAQAHSIAHEAQHRLIETLDGVRDVLIHVEPQPGAPHRPHSDLQAEVRTVARGLGVPIHHLNAHEVAGQYSVDLHLEVPDGLTLRQAHAQASLLEDEIKVQIPEVAEIHTHIEPTAATPAKCDEALRDLQREQIVRELTRDVPGVRDCHDVKVRQIGAKLFLTLHCVLDEQLPVAEAHDIATLVEERLRRGCPDIASVSVHVEPATSDPPS